MNFYVILGVPQEASTADIKRAYRRLARRYHPGVNPGDRAAEEMFRADRRGLRNPRRSGTAPAVRHGGRARAPRGRRRRRSCSRSSIFLPRSADRRRRRSPSCSPTSCIRCRAARAARPEVGADLHAALTVSFADAVHGVERQVLVTRQVAVRRVRRRAGRLRSPKRSAGSVRGRARPLGARPHGVLEAVRGVRRRGPADARALRGLRGSGPRRPRRSGEPSRCPPGITDGGRLRVRGDGARRAGTAAAPATCT